MNGRDIAVATRSMRAIGTAVSVAVTDVERADEALALLADHLAALDDTCSRFREDSEIRLLELRSHGQPVTVSPLLFEAVSVACDVAVRTAGTVDPTVGSALVDLGYDRDFDMIGPGGPATDHPPVPAPGWWRIDVDPQACSISVPSGIHLDLGATAKAFAADRAANALAARLGCGVLVNLGGDIAVEGRAPAGGWAVGIAARCTARADEVDLVLSLHSGGVATSGITARTWTRGGRQLHHIVDPWTGQPAPPAWPVVSTLGRSCVEANAWSTAAVVWGVDAVGNLAANGVPARLVDAEGRVTVVGAWPAGLGADDTQGRIA